VSLFSVVCGLGAVAIVYWTALRLGRSVIAAATAAMVLGLVPMVWTWSVVPEVFALHDLLVAALVALLVEWHLTGAPRWFIAAAFVGGLGMANHQTIVLLGPAILWLMFARRQLFRGGGLFIRATAAFAIGLVPYAYLPAAAARHPAFNWGEFASLRDVVDHVLRVDYGTGQLVSEARFQGGPITDRLGDLAASFGVAEAALVALGAVLLYRRDRALFWFFLGGLLVAGPGFVAYSNINITAGVARTVLERFFLMGHVIVAPLAALGIVFVGELASRRAGQAMARATTVGVSALAIVASLAVAFAGFGTIDKSDDHIARTFGEDILRTVRPGAILFAGGDPIVMPVDYIRAVEGARPDIRFVQIPLLRAEWYVRQLKRVEPTLVLRYASFDGFPGTMRAFIEPNDPAQFDIIGQLLDDTMGSTHTFVPRGLTSELRPKNALPDTDTLATDNERVLATYRIPSFESVAADQWDRVILGDYGSAAYQLGILYEQQKRYPQARSWFERALAIDPDFIDARQSLARLPPP
jgi:tetratricopeptide (TPR) repeat protein